MLEDVVREFVNLERMSNTVLNRQLLAQLEERLAENPDNPNLVLVRANLARRCGDLALARDNFATFLTLTGGDLETQLPSQNATPVAQASIDGLSIAPVIVIDDFLPSEQMRDLLVYAAASRERFRNANTNSDAREYNPDKRRTLVFWEFEPLRQHFLDFINRELPALQKGLNLPQFDVLRTEIKMTAHVDGGFFKPHADNLAPLCESGRAITWLYYFSEDPPQFEGGDLYLLDSEMYGRPHSQNWFTKIIPWPNRFVAFPSWYHHAVAPTTLASGDFAQARFAISSHIRKTADNGADPAK